MTQPNPSAAPANSPEAPSSRRFWALAALCLAVVSVGATIAAGCAPLREMPWDYTILLDGAWRIIHGQIPHVDFYAPIGAFPLLIYAIGMRISPTGDALAWGSAILAAFLYGFAWFAVRTRLSGVAAFAFTAMTGLLILAPRSLGFPPTHTSYAMHYNRIGWALVGIAVVLLLPVRAPNVAGRNSDDPASHVLTGFLCGLLVFTKINYLLAAICLSAAFAFLNRKRPVALARFAAGCLVSTGALLAWLRFDVAAFLRDLRMVAANASTRGLAQGIADRVGRIIFSGWYSADVLSVVAVALCLLWMSIRGCRNLRYLFLPALLVIPFGFFVCSTNAQKNEIPLVAIALLLTAELFQRAHVPSQRNSQTILSLLALLLTAWIAVPDLTAVAYSFGWNLTAQSRLAAADRIQSPAMRNIPLPPLTFEIGEPAAKSLERYAALQPERDATPHQYLQVLNTGIALIRPHIGPSTRVVALDAENPFSFALGLPPARGGALYWHYGLGFTDTAHPDPDRTLEEADLVIVPLNISTLNATKIVGLFTESLNRRFRQIDENRLFRLYARK